MSENKFTPGPWVSEFNEKAGTVYLLGKHSDADRCRASDGLGYIFPLMVCLERGAENRYPEICPEQMANARLIAAAPDLLEALQNLLTDLEEGDFVRTSRMDAARSAIRKATGG